MKLLTGAIVALVSLAVAAPANAGTDGAFHADCEFSHRAQDDPIVNFGMPGGASHMHDFSGSKTLNAYSTTTSIRSAPNNCVRTDTPAWNSDRSAYWVPTLFVNNVAVTETKLGAYYSTGQRDPAAIKAFPTNLVMIAGSAKGGPQEVDGERVWAFMCRGGVKYYGSATAAPTCATPEIEMVIRFPDCWNGVSTDSADHKSHMAYSRKVNGAAKATCPSTHPVMQPKLQIAMRYPTAGGPSLRLSSGPINTAHADFMNGWDMTKLNSLVSTCLNADTYCGGGDRPM